MHSIKSAISRYAIDRYPSLPRCDLVVPLVVAPNYYLGGLGSNPVKALSLSGIFSGIA